MMVMEHCKTLHHESKYFFKNQDAILIKGKESFHDGKGLNVLLFPLSPLNKKVFRIPKFD